MSDENVVSNWSVEKLTDFFSKKWCERGYCKEVRRQTFSISIVVTMDNA